MRHSIFIIIILCFLTAVNAVGQTVSISELKRAANSGNAYAQHDLAMCYYNGDRVKQSYAEAVKLFRNAADSGVAESQFMLGLCYYEGNGVEQSYAEAVKLFRKTADSGVVNAQYMLSVCYYGGKGVEQSYDEAVKWVRKAADSSDARSMYALGAYYYDGFGVEQSYEEAVKWFRKAAELGNADAQYQLGVCYIEAKGVENNDDEVYKWISKAAKNGNAQAAELMVTIQESIDQGLYIPPKEDVPQPPSQQSTYRRTLSHPLGFGYLYVPAADRGPLGLSVGVVRKQWEYKVRKGYESNYVSSVEKYGAFANAGEAKDVQGIQVGLRYNPQFANGFGLNTGIFYEYYSDRSNDHLYQDLYKYYLTWNEHALNVPLHLEYRVGLSDMFQVFVSSGASIDYGLSSTVKVRFYEAIKQPEGVSAYGDEFKQFNASWDFGAGIRFSCFQLQWQMSKGLVNMANKDAEFTVKQNKLMSLSLSWMF